MTSDLEVTHLERLFKENRIHCFNLRHSERRVLGRKCGQTPGINQERVEGYHDFPLAPVNVAFGNDDA